MPPSKLSLISDDDFAGFVANSTSWCQIASKCGLAGGSHHNKVKARAMTMKLDAEHIGKTKVEKTSDEEFSRIVANATTWHQVLVQCNGNKNSGTQRKQVQRRAMAMKLNTEHITGRTRAIDRVSDEDFTVFVANSIKWRQVLRKCGIPHSNSQLHDQAKKRALDLNLDTRHITKLTSYDQMRGKRKRTRSKW